MKILIEDIPDEGIEVEVNEVVDVGEIMLKAPVKGALSIKKIGDEVLIEGNMEAIAEFECSRCLKKYSTDVKLDIQTTYRPLKELDGEGTHEIKEDELEIGFYSDNELDILDVAREQILLNMPIKLLCDDACKGICQKCGKDLNLSSCNCSAEVADPRFEVLKKVFPKGKEKK